LQYLKKKICLQLFADQTLKINIAHNRPGGGGGRGGHSNRGGGNFNSAPRQYQSAPPMYQDGFAAGPGDQIFVCFFFEYFKHISAVGGGNFRGGNQMFGGGPQNYGEIFSTNLKINVHF
jgi:hypothetical protein